jgi:hypothetical protein
MSLHASEGSVSYVSIFVAALVAFVFSSLYYSPLLLGNLWRAVDPAAAGIAFAPWKPIVELLRTMAIALVIARLLPAEGRKEVGWAVSFALWIWFGFSALMWVGAVMWEGTPWQVAVIHSGDWLVKVVLIAVILSAWRKRRSS